MRRAQFIIGCWLVFMAAFDSLQAQSSSPSMDLTPPHTRISQTEVAGRRVELRSLKGARLFVSPKFNANVRSPLVIHFHGAPWLVEYQIANRVPNAALITVQLGAGSSVYNRPFDKTDTFQTMMDEAKQVLGLKHEWSSVTLTGWSAGYGAIRAIIRNERYFELVDNILLLDGIHASYSPEGIPLAAGGAIKEDDIEPFVRFAREAAKGKKSFVLTHSQIFPGAYASTTECVQYVIDSVGIRRTRNTRDMPAGMRQLSSVDKKHLHVRGYAGNTAADHVDHINSMGEWLALLKIK